MRTFVFNWLFLAIMVFSPRLSAQTYEWVKTFGDTGFDVGRDVVTDTSGNIYVCGYFFGTVDFDPGTGNDIHTTNGGFDLYVLKLDANGSYLWAKTIGGSGGDYAYSLSLDDSNNLYVTGHFADSVDFDPGQGADIHISNGNWDVFVMKLDTNGNFIWAKTFGSNNYDEGFSCVVDGTGNVYTTGYFNGTVDFDPGSGSDIHSVNGDKDVFVQKLDPNGNFIWARTFGGNYEDVGMSIAFDHIGSIFVTGWFKGSVDFDTSQGTTDIHTSSGQTDIFIEKLDASGNFSWARTFGGADYDYANTIVVDNAGNVLTSGSFLQTVDFDPGTGVDNHTANSYEDIFVQKLDKNGNFIWAGTFGGTGHDKGFGVDVDVSDNVYLTGQFFGTVDFDPSSSTNNLTSLGNYDVFIQKLDSNANFQWAVNFGGANNENPHAITIDRLGNIISTGSFLETADFDPGSGSDNHTSHGNADIFIHKMSQSATWVMSNTFSNFCNIFPNPAHRTIFILLDKAYPVIQVRLYDISGKVLLKRTFSRGNNFLFSFGDIKKGIYLLEVETNNQTGVLKLVVE